MNEFGAELAARRGEEMRDNEIDFTDLGNQRSRAFHIRLWLKRPFDIRTQIALPTDRFKHLYYIAFIDIYP
jgi:hypothetical protein